MQRRKTFGVIAAAVVILAIAAVALNIADPTFASPTAEPIGNPAANAGGAEPAPYSMRGDGP